MPSPPPPDDTFLALYNGPLTGLRSREAHKEVADRLPVDREWYLIDPQADPVPTAVAIAGDTVREAIRGVVDELAPLHKAGDGTGWTFAGETDGDWLIKVFNPRQCGSGCGCYSPDPWRVYTTRRPSPEALVAITPPPKEQPQGGLVRLKEKARELLG
jgi:hypothetical protein